MAEGLNSALERLTAAIQEAREETAAVRVELQEERQQAVTERQRRRRTSMVAVGTAVALALSLVVGVLGYVGQRKAADRAAGERERILNVVSVDCPALRDFATYDIPPGSGELARRLVRNFYASYTGRCADITGPLPPLDPDATRPPPATPLSPTPTAPRSPSPTSTR